VALSRADFRTVIVLGSLGLLSRSLKIKRTNTERNLIPIFAKRRFITGFIGRCVLERIIIGCKRSKAALVVLTERLTRYPLIVRVPYHTMASVVRALDRIERRAGAAFRKIFKKMKPTRTARFEWADRTAMGHRVTVTYQVGLYL